MLYKAGAAKNPANPQKKINARWSFFSKLCLERNPMAGGFSSNLLKPSRTPSIQNTPNNNNNNNDNDKQRILQY